MSESGVNCSRAEEGAGKREERKRKQKTEKPKSRPLTPHKVAATACWWRRRLLGGLAAVRDRLEVLAEAFEEASPWPSEISRSTSSRAK